MPDPDLQRHRPPSEQAGAYPVSYTHLDVYKRQFGDNIERAARSGVVCVAQPGGSIRDDNVIETADKYGKMCIRDRHKIRAGREKFLSLWMKMRRGPEKPLSFRGKTYIIELSLSLIHI